MDLSTALLLAIIGFFIAVCTPLCMYQYWNDVYKDKWGAEEKKKNIMRKSWIGIVIGILMCIPLLFVIPSESASSNSATDAKIYAQIAVKRNLKSPSTAKFCKYDEMTAENTSGNNWEITGYVDAQNSFGAELREYWTVTLTLTDDGCTNTRVSFQ